MTRPSNPDDFWVKLDRSHARGCWIWCNYVNVGGYGYTSYRGRLVLAHRLAWELAHGPIPGVPGTTGTCVCHHCDNRRCCNPSHLYLGTAQTNAVDRETRARGRDSRGDLKGCNVLTWPEALAIRRRRLGGERRMDLAIEFGVSQHLVYLISANKVWKEYTRHSD